METECAESRRCQNAEVSRCWRYVQLLASGRAVRANDRLLEATRALRFDQLSAERAQERRRSRRDAHGPQSAQRAGSGTEHPVVSHEAQKVGVVVVEREDPPQAFG